MTRTDTHERGIERDECYNPLCETELTCSVAEDEEGYCSWECAVMARDGYAARVLREQEGSA